LFVFGS